MTVIDSLLSFTMLVHTFVWRVQMTIYCVYPYTLYKWPFSWWCHQMETFSALLAICARNSLVTGEFPAQRPVTHSFDVFFDLRLNKRLSKQSWGWWSEMPSRPLWRHYNVNMRAHFLEFCSCYCAAIACQIYFVRYTGNINCFIVTPNFIIQLKKLKKYYWVHLVIITMQTLYGILHEVPMALNIISINTFTI